MRPRSIRILGKEFEICYDDLSKDNELGRLESSKYRITIDQNLKGRELTQTIFHEVIHAVLYLTGHSHWMGDSREESVVLALEHGLLDFMNLKLHSKHK